MPRRSREVLIAMGDARELKYGAGTSHPMPETDTVRVIAGASTTTFFTGADGAWTPEREQHGRMVTVVKPDGTTLVHDATGYQPVAWLTRPERVAVEREPPSPGDGSDATLVTAVDGDSRLRVRVRETAGPARHPVSAAGEPVGTCGCGGRLVRVAGGVACVACDDRYGLPSGASVLDEACPDCGLPRFRVERGRAFTPCLDRECESLDAAVTAALDREWDCPDCGAPLRVLRRGGLLLGCDAYPDCEVGYPVPDGVVTGDCDCGLPRFEARATGEHRCLDGECGHGVVD
jgi:DNA topoisomerase-1